MTIALKGNWSFPTKIQFGAGRIRELPKTLKGVRVERPLIVTDSGLRDLPAFTGMEEMLREAGVAATVFSDVKGNPVGKNVYDGVAAYRENACDGVIAVGGGSGLDAGKVIALMAGQDCPIWDFDETPGAWKKADAGKIPPIIAIPTTAGTGSEVGCAGVIVNEETKVKVIIFHPRMLPATVIADPELTVGLPAKVTAATGMDALTHCIEAYSVPVFHPMADGIALNGMHLVEVALPIACRDGADIDARSKMLAAASMGAVAFQKGLGGVHAIAHAVGGLYDTHHGLTNAVLLPYVMAFNRDAIADKIPLMAQTLNLPRHDFTGVLDWVIGFREHLGIPGTLAEIGVDTDQADAVGETASKDSCARGNPRPVTAADLRGLFLDAVEGRL